MFCVMHVFYLLFYAKNDLVHNFDLFSRLFSMHVDENFHAGSLISRRLLVGELVAGRIRSPSLERCGREKRVDGAGLTRTPLG